MKTVASGYEFHKEVNTKKRFFMRIILALIIH